MLESLTGIKGNFEHITINLLLFLILLGIWMYFREDFYKYMFVGNSSRRAQGPL
jgi:hypothetical protein